MKAGINKIKAQIKNWADEKGFTRVGEWWNRVRILKPTYTSTEADIIRQVHTLYNKNKLQDVYKPVGETILAYDAENKKPLFSSEPVNFEEVQRHILEVRAGTICRDITAYCEQREVRMLNAFYANDPTNLFCFFLLKFTWELSLQVGQGTDIKALETSQKKCKALIALLNELTINDVFTNELHSTDGINNLFQNTVTHYRAFIKQIGTEILSLTAKDHFKNLYLQALVVIDRTTRALMYLPSDIELLQNFSVTKALESGVVDRRQDKAMNTRIGELMRILLGTNEMQYLFPKEKDGKTTSISMADALPLVYTNQIVAQRGADRPKMTNVFTNASHQTNQNYTAFLKQDNQALSACKDSDAVAAILRKGEYRSTGIHNDLIALIAEDVVEIFKLTNDLALCTIGVKLFYEKVAGAFGDFGAYVFGARLNEMLLSSLDQTTQLLQERWDNVETTINKEYMDAKRRNGRPPEWKNNFGYHQGLLRSTLQQLSDLSELSKTVQLELSKMTTEQRVEQMYQGLCLLQGILGDIYIRTSTHHTLRGMPRWGMALAVDQLISDRQQTPIPLPFLPRVELRIEELSDDAEVATQPSPTPNTPAVTKTKDELLKDASNALKDAEDALSAFIKEYSSHPSDKAFAQAMITAIVARDKETILAYMRDSTRHILITAIDLSYTLEALIRSCTNESREGIEGQLVQWKARLEGKLGSSGSKAQSGSSPSNTGRSSGSTPRSIELS